MIDWQSVERWKEKLSTVGRNFPPTRSHGGKPRWKVVPLKGDNFPHRPYRGCAGCSLAFHNVEAMRVGPGEEKRIANHD